MTTKNRRPPLSPTPPYSVIPFAKNEIVKSDHKNQLVTDVETHESMISKPRAQTLPRKTKCETYIAHLQKTGPRIRPEIVDLATLKKCAIGLNTLTKPRCNPECPFAPALSQDWQHTHNIFETRLRFGYGLMLYQDGRLENPISREPT